MEKYKDAYGQEIYDYYSNKGGFELIEREDGYLDLSSGPANYFWEYKKWLGCERKAIRFAKGKVLDIGSGAGRVGLHLQSKGIDVLGIDTSPLALKVCRDRGFKKVKLMSITQLSRKIGLFDTIVMYGNNFGLFGNFNRAKWLLKRFYNMTTADSRIIAQTVDPYDTDNPDHLAYQRYNRAKGKMPGQLRIRVRYKKSVSDWFEYLIVSRDEMKQILEGTGWKIRHFINSKGPIYMAIIEKEKRNETCRY